MSSDNTPLLVQRNESGFWTRAEHIDAEKSVLGFGYMLRQIYGASSAITGTLAETTIPGRATIVPGGLLGNTGSLRIFAAFSGTVSANLKTLKMYLGSQLVSDAMQFTNQGGLTIDKIVANRGSGSTNKFFAEIGNVSLAGFGISTTTTVDTDIEQSLTFTVTLANASDSVQMVGLQVLAFPG